MSRLGSVYLGMFACLNVMCGIADKTMKHFDNKFYVVAMVIALCVWLSVTINIFRMRREYDTRGTIKSEERN